MAPAVKEARWNRISTSIPAHSQRPTDLGKLRPGMQVSTPMYGMDGIPDGIYIDTPENRELIRKGLGLYPDYRNWRDDFDPSFVAELDVMQ